ncbi:MAG: tetratricopeptide repeat protein [Acidobacteriota bacterium]|nr:tetratricopeptide repeat protein [Acidobacteriota bacterium]
MSAKGRRYIEVGALPAPLVRTIGEPTRDCHGKFQIALARFDILIADYASMDIALTNARHRTFVIAGCAVIAAVLIFQAIELWIENRWINSQNVSLVERGATLIPSDAAAWDNLGHLRQWKLAGSDLRGAIDAYRRALRQDPRSADYWMDLASAEEASGNAGEAAKAFVRAQAVYPDSAEVAFYYGNFLLRQADYGPGFAQLRRAVEEDPSLLPMAISRAWRATGSASQIVDRLLPPSTSAYLRAIDYFAGIHQCDAALSVWTGVAESRVGVAVSSTFPLLNELIAQDRSDDARRVWSQVASSEARPGHGESRSVLWNGDFVTDFADGGLGWRWTPMTGVYVAFETAPSGDGARALRLDFNGGSNLDLEGPYQYVPVEPGQAYHFHALMRTDSITTESGPRFSITDPNHASAVDVVTNNFTGSHGWSPVDADFVVSPQTHFVVVRLIRPPSRLFDNKLSGTLWIADVSLVPMPSNEGLRP